MNIYKKFVYFINYQNNIIKLYSFPKLKLIIHNQVGNTHVFTLVTVVRKQEAVLDFV
jgi:hypothetical protein